MIRPSRPFGIFAFASVSALSIGLLSASLAFGQAVPPDPSAPLPPPDPAMTPGPAPAPLDPAVPAPAPAPLDPAVPAPAPAPLDPAVPAPAPAPGDPAMTPTPVPGVTAAPVGDKALLELISNLWHYAYIGKWDLAAEEAKKLAAQPNSEEMYDLMLAEAKKRNTDLMLVLLKWQQLEIGETDPKTQPMKEPVTQIITKLNEILATRADRPEFIIEQLKNLSGGEKAFANAKQRLVQSGEVIVPHMLDILRDSAQAQYHAGIRRAMRELGRSILNPLVAATESRDPAILLPVLDAISSMSNPDALPYLQRILEDPRSPAALKAQVSSAINRMGFEVQGSTAGDSFFELAQRFYYTAPGRGGPAISADERRPMAFVWFWDNTRGLTRRDVPHGVFNDIMAMRSAENALKLGSKGDAASLWLAANNKRETDLKPGETEPIYSDSPAHLWNVWLGTKFSNAVLERAIKDQNPAVAIKVIKSLQEITGQSNMFAQGDSPLMRAMNFPDRLVRYEAAFAIASAMPQKPFSGQGWVVLLLADAVSQTGTGGVLILAQDEDMLKTISAALPAYTVAGGTTADAVMANAAKLPSIDVILFTEEVPTQQLEALRAAAANNPRTQQAAQLVMADQKFGEWSRFALTAPLLSVTNVPPGDTLPAAVEAARVKAGVPPLEATQAGEYSLRAAQMLEKLAVSRSVLDLSTTEPTLLAALNDKRADNVKAVSGVLGLMQSTKVQPALLEEALAQDTDATVKPALLKGLATNAKFFGNKLSQPQTESLRKFVQAEPPGDTKNAAAEALGALNLPVEQVKDLILNRGGTNNTGPVATP